MPAENSRLKGFYKLSVKERRDLVAELAGLDKEAVNALAATGELTVLLLIGLLKCSRNIGTTRRCCNQFHH